MLPAIKAKAEFHASNPSLLTQRGNCCCCFLEAMPSRHLLKRSSCRVWSSQIPRHSHVTARDVFRIKDTFRESVYSELLRICTPMKVREPDLCCSGWKAKNDWIYIYWFFVVYRAPVRDNKDVWGCGYTQSCDSCVCYPELQWSMINYVLTI